MTLYNISSQSSPSNHKCVGRVMSINNRNEIGRKGNALLSFLFFLSFLACYCASEHIVTPTQYVRDPNTVTSSGEVFTLGFFSPGNSSNRYVGIWYNKIPGSTIVWVANRENPLKDSSGVFTIANDGNLVVMDGQSNILWTTNVSKLAVNSSVAELLDSGNLVLRDVLSDKRTLWQSFKHPSDTFLPTMKIGANKKTGEKQQLTSWKGESDPSPGNFFLGIDPINIPQMVVWNGSHRHYRSGPWNNRVFIGIDGMYSVYLDGFHLNTDDEEGSVSITFKYTDNSFVVRYVLQSHGQVVGIGWDVEEKVWFPFWSGPNNECDVYNACGPFGSCNVADSPMCSCLKGFMPKSKEEWSKRNWSGGCVRRTLLLCERNTANGTERKEADGFLKLAKVKVPDYVNWWNFEDIRACQQECLINCSCVAYSFENNIGCMWWNGNLIDIQKFHESGADLYIRVAHSELTDAPEPMDAHSEPTDAPEPSDAHSELDKKKDVKKFIIPAVLIGIVILGMCTFCAWSLMAKQRGRKMNPDLEIHTSKIEGAHIESSDQNMLGDNPDLKIFNFEKLISATNNFSFANMLGQGGFGSVYKGKLPDGQEIAVKRLSKSSGQGIEEFKNEVVVISKLQHRNLVRLLGCCIAGEEYMLIYEYMLNNNLGTFLFDPNKRTLLDWRKRFEIIVGISRGVLYLHRDSRLRVIHRDLKASNILLDEELNPKISDFGMARIFGGDKLQASTKRIVGTYGYMAPEYAMEGHFSEKSDVFSFGVLLLEIVSGKRNNGFCSQEQSLSLLRYAWELWNENKMQLLIDPTLSKSPVFEQEILRCMHVGLLCVQESPRHRPTMSTTLSMLTSEISTLPAPNLPAFTERHVSSDSNPSARNDELFSTNSVTITNIEGR